MARYDGDTWTAYGGSYGMGNVQSLADKYVYSAALAPDGLVWFGTTSGVSCFDGQDWITYITSSGLIEKHGYSIAIAPDGVVWIGTEGGVSRFDPSG